MLIQLIAGLLAARGEEAPHSLLAQPLDLTATRATANEPTGPDRHP